MTLAERILALTKQGMDFSAIAAILNVTAEQVEEVWLDPAVEIPDSGGGFAASVLRCVSAGVTGIAQNTSKHIPWARERLEGEDLELKASEEDGPCDCVLVKTTGVYAITCEVGVNSEGSAGGFLESAALQLLPEAADWGCDVYVESPKKAADEGVDLVLGVTAPMASGDELHALAAGNGLGDVWNIEEGPGKLLIVRLR